MRYRLPMPPQGMKRSGSESEISEGEDGPIKDYRDYKVRKSRLIGMINWTHVLGCYQPHIMMAGIAALFGQIVYKGITQVSSFTGPENEMWTIANMIGVLVEIRNIVISILQGLVITEEESQVVLFTGIKITLLTLICVWLLGRMDNAVFLLSFSTFKAPTEWKCSHEQIMDMMVRQKVFTKESLDFMRRLLERSGTGQATAWPPGIVQCLHGLPTDNSIEGSRKESETILCDVVEKALKKANLSPEEIDILVINCSLFSPTPSLCSVVVKKFGMRSDIVTYNLSGMGCSASLISIDLAKNLLQRRSSGGRALVVSTEIITPNLYHGNERGFLIQNILFRCGGAAIILSSKRRDGQRAWYKLLHTVRVQGASEDAYRAVYETEDKCGKRGVRLSKEIVKVAGKCMEKNLTTLGPYVLPLTEQIKVLFSIVNRYIVKTLRKVFLSWGKEKWVAKLPLLKVFVPDFKRGIDHFCIHAGGRAVLDGIEKNMKLELFHTEASRMALLNYGNTSSSSIWYELEYIHYHQKTNPLRKGHRIMQVAFGSGFKCTSGVWLKL